MTIKKLEKLATVWHKFLMVENFDESGLGKLRGVRHLVDMRTRFRNHMISNLIYDLHT